MKVLYLLLMLSKSEEYHFNKYEVDLVYAHFLPVRFD